MQYFPASLRELADQFARLPGIGGKTAQRLAFYVLGLSLEDAQAFADAMAHIASGVSPEARRLMIALCKTVAEQDRLSDMDN